MILPPGSGPMDAAHKADPCGSDYVTLVTVSPTLNHLISIPREVKYKCSSAILLYCTLSRVNAHWIIRHGGGSKVTFSTVQNTIRWKKKLHPVWWAHVYLESDFTKYLFMFLFLTIYKCCFRPCNTCIILLRVFFFFINTCFWSQWNSAFNGIFSGLWGKLYM